VQPDRPYWESWTAALEDLLATSGLLPADVLEDSMRGIAPVDEGLLA